MGQPLSLKGLQYQIEVYHLHIIIREGVQKGGIETQQLKGGIRTQQYRRYRYIIIKEYYRYIIIQGWYIRMKEVSYEVVNAFIMTIKCCAIREMDRFLTQYDSSLVNRLDTQMRQPSLYFASILVDHEVSYEIMRKLIDHGANPRFKDQIEQTVLFYVCREGKEKCLELLLNQGLSLESEDMYGQTPLFYAANHNRLNIIHKFLECKVNFNHLDKIAGQTALFYAARQGHLEMVKMLIEAGSNPSISDTANKIPTHYAKKHNKNEKNEVCEYLINCIQNARELKKVSGDVKVDLSKSKKKKEGTSVGGQTKSQYKLCRSDTLGNYTELSAGDYEDLLREKPELREMLMNPDDMDMSCLQEIKLQDRWLRNANKILNTCRNCKGGHHFHQPVDTVKFKIDNYYDIITEPMDFGTIRNKLKYNIYNNIEQFTSDMKLVFDNCVRYNGIENPVAKQAIDVRNEFEENMKSYGYSI